MLDYPLSEQAEYFIAAAEGLKPLVERHRIALAQGPDIPLPLAQAIKEAGLVRLWLPRAFGGAELPPLDYLRVIEALAKLDGSVAWCAGISSNGSRIGGLISTDAANTLFSADGFVNGSGNPTGAAVREAKGWRIKGRWSWATFIRHSSTTAAMCVEQENGVIRRTSEGVPMLRLVMLPTDKVSILGDWDSCGLRATGSHGFVIDDAWVPDDHTIDCSQFPIRSFQTGILYQLPFFSAFAIGLVGIPLGIAAASIDALISIAQTKVSTGTVAPLCKQHLVQMDVAQAVTSFRSARAFLFEAVASMWTTVAAGDGATLEQRALLRMACWNVAHTGKKIVDRMFAAAGGTAVGEGACFGAQSRDIRAAGQHIEFAIRNMETAGRIFLGQEPKTERI
jgi:alkylation response protein AidB-like acyl-CoA dehydrogenase